MSESLSIFATVIGLLGLSGGAVGYFAKSRGDSIIKYQAVELDLRDKAIARLEKDLAAANTKNDTLEKQNAEYASTLRNEISALAKVVKQRHNRSV